MGVVSDDTSTGRSAPKCDHPALPVDPPDFALARSARGRPPFAAALAIPRTGGSQRLPTNNPEFPFFLAAEFS